MEILSPTILLGYIGPDTMMPIASILAAIAGGFMMGGRFLMARVKSFGRRLFGHRAPTVPMDETNCHESEKLSS